MDGAKTQEARVEFMLVFYQDHQGTADPELIGEMGQFAGQLAQEGKMRGGAPLHPVEEGARIRIRDGEASVTDGPFTETKEIIAGFFLIDCESREEAIELAVKCPHARAGLVEVRQVIPMGGPPS